MTEAIKSTIDNKRFGCGVFINFKKAFGTVNHDILLTHSVRDAHLCTRSPPPPFDEMRIYAHRNHHDCTPRRAFERIFLLVNLNENRWTIGYITIIDGKPFC